MSFNDITEKLTGAAFGSVVALCLMPLISQAAQESDPNQPEESIWSNIPSQFFAQCPLLFQIDSWSEDVQNDDADHTQWKRICL